MLSGGKGSEDGPTLRGKIDQETKSKPWPSVIFVPFHPLSPSESVHGRVRNSCDLCLCVYRAPLPLGNPVGFKVRKSVGIKRTHLEPIKDGVLGPLWSRQWPAAWPWGWSPLWGWGPWGPVTIYACPVAGCVSDSCPGKSSLLALFSYLDFVRNLANEGCSCVRAFGAFPRILNSYYLLVNETKERLSGHQVLSVLFPAVACPASLPLQTVCPGLGAPLSFPDVESGLPVCPAHCCQGGACRVRFQPLTRILRRELCLSWTSHPLSLWLRTAAVVCGFCGS